MPARSCIRGSRRAARRRARTTWWGKAWVRAVEEAAYAEADLVASRTLARGGHVGQIATEPGGFVASVEDRRGLWTVAGTVPVLDAAAVEALVETVAAEAGRIAALLAGELPHSLVEHAEEAGVELLPYGGELGSSCTCDHWVDPCAHALAVLQQLAWLIEADPFVLLQLRGLPRDELLARLHARHRGAGRGRRPGGRAGGGALRRPDAGRGGQRTPSDPSAIRLSTSRICGSGSRPLCGVELISPNAACAIARAVGEVELAVGELELAGPQVDVLPLQGADPLAGLGRERLPVAVLDDDQRPVPQREVDVPLDERGQRGARTVGRRDPLRCRHGAAPR